MPERSALVGYFQNAYEARGRLRAAGYTQGGGGSGRLEYWWHPQAADPVLLILSRTGSATITTEEACE